MRTRAAHITRRRMRDMHQCKGYYANVALWPPSRMSSLLCENHSKCRGTAVASTEMCYLSSKNHQANIELGNVASARVSQQLLNGNYEDLGGELITTRAILNIYDLLSLQGLRTSSSSYSVGNRVAQSSSLYSMSSGASILSGKLFYYFQTNTITENIRAKHRQFEWNALFQYLFERVCIVVFSYKKRRSYCWRAKCAAYRQTTAPQPPTFGKLFRRLQRSLSTKYTSSSSASAIQFPSQTQQELSVD